MPTIPPSHISAPHVDPAARDYVNARISEELKPLVDAISATNVQIAAILANLEMIQGTVSAIQNRTAQRDVDMGTLRGGRR